MKIHSVLLIGLSVSMVGCLPVDTKKSSGSASSGSEAPNPGFVPPAPTPPAQKLESSRGGPLVHREYILQVLHEVFYSATYYPTADNIIYGYGGQRSQLARPSVFGLSCDVYGSSGDLDCNDDTASGSSAPLMVEASAVRQLAKLKLCEQLASYSNGPKAAAEKIGELTGSTLKDLNATSLPKVFSLFYRNRDMSTAELNAYVAFNASLVTRSVDLTSRWRAVLTMMCESPEWEVL